MAYSLNMDRSTIEKVNRIIASVLHRKAAAGENILRSEIPEWDSIAHAGIIVSLEEEFGIEFEASDLAAIASSHGFAGAIEKTKALSRQQPA